MPLGMFRHVSYAGMAKIRPMWRNKGTREDISEFEFLDDIVE